MNLSPAFYDIVNHSLEYTAVMGLSKLYEDNKDVMSIHKIINICDSFANLFPNSRKSNYQGEDGNTIVYIETVVIVIHEDIKQV